MLYYITLYCLICIYIYIYRERERLPSSCRRRPRRSARPDPPNPARKSLKLQWLPFIRKGIVPCARKSFNIQGNTSEFYIRGIRAKESTPNRAQVPTCYAASLPPGKGKSPASWSGTLCREAGRSRRMIHDDYKLLLYILSSYMITIIVNSLSLLLFRPLTGCGNLRCAVPCRQVRWKGGRSDVSSHAWIRCYIILCYIMLYMYIHVYIYIYIYIRTYWYISLYIYIYIERERDIHTYLYVFRIEPPKTGRTEQGVTAEAGYASRRC